MPSSTEAARFQSLIAQLSGAALQAVQALWQQTQDVEVLQEQYPLLVDPFMAGAQSMAAEWYRSLAPDVDFPVTTPELTPTDALQASTRWAVTQPDPLAALEGSTERRVFDASRATIKHNADREGVRYARHASANACAFCRMLATRDDLYASKESATRVVGRSGRPRGTRKLGDKFHDRCHCTYVPVRAGDSYQPPDYVAQWEDDYANAREDEGGDPKDIINHMRRTEYARKNGATD